MVFAYLSDVDCNVQVSHEGGRTSAKKMRPPFLPPNLEHLGGARSQGKIGEISDRDIGTQVVKPSDFDGGSDRTTRSDLFSKR